MRRIQQAVLLSLMCVWTLSLPLVVSSFNLVFMAKRGRKGGLQRNLDDEGSSSRAPKSSRSVNQGRGQEITGVTLPAEGSLKGWEFGDGVQMACANVGGTFFAIQGACPRCAFDLFKGDLIVDDPGFEDLPRIACPTCATTYGLRSGQPGPRIKRKGLQAFVGNLAKTATETDAGKNAKVFAITRDEDTARVFCREK